MGGCMRIIRFIRFLRRAQGAKLFFVAVVIVYADEGTAEGEDFAKGDEHAVVYLAQWRAAEARDEQCAAETAHCHSGQELQAFHTHA